MQNQNHFYRLFILCLVMIGTFCTQHTSAQTRIGVGSEVQFFSGEWNVYSQQIGISTQIQQQLNEKIVLSLKAGYLPVNETLIPNLKFYEFPIHLGVKYYVWNKAYTSLSGGVNIRKTQINLPERINTYLLDKDTQMQFSTGLGYEIPIKELVIIDLGVRYEMTIYKDTTPNRNAFSLQAGVALPLFCKR